MAVLKKNNTINLIALLGISVSLVLTPWLNVDSLVIPKLATLFCGSLFLLPRLFNIPKNYYRSKIFLLLISIMSLFIIQSLIVMIKSQAPWEQQIFGRTGRGYGFLLFFSLVIILLLTSININYSKLQIIIFGLFLSCMASSVYSIFQYHGLDIFNWVSATNGIIGTLGNPNFQSSFVATAFIPSLVYCWTFKGRYFYSIVTISLLTYTLFICESTQGYIALILSIFIYVLLFLFYKNKLLFSLMSGFFVISSIFAVLGMLNKGLFASLLYKASVQSRGEMWRSAFNGSNSNPFFGVGLDSFGDVSFLYRDQKDADGIGEFTDNAHNVFLQFSVTGGYPLMLIYISMVIFTFYCILSFQKKLGKFDAKLSCLISAWFALQAQSFISPGSITIFLWTFLLTGSLVGLKLNEMQESKLDNQSKTINQNFSLVFAYPLLLVGVFIIYPLVSSDALTLKSLNTRDGILAVKAAKAYPQSVVRYQRITGELLKSNLPVQSLDTARSAVKFNPNAMSGWLFILANETAPIEERRKAKKEVLRLDPFNKLIRDFKI